VLLRVPDWSPRRELPADPWPRPQPRPATQWTWPAVPLAAVLLLAAGLALRWYLFPVPPSLGPGAGVDEEAGEVLTLPALEPALAWTDPPPSCPPATTAGVHSANPAPDGRWRPVPRLSPPEGGGPP
jgi:hypothetical protein